MSAKGCMVPLLFSACGGSSQELATWYEQTILNVLGRNAAKVDKKVKALGNCIGFRGLFLLRNFLI